MTPMRELVDRANRYKLAAPLRYRRHGELTWRVGETINLSKSGVLFAAQLPLPPGTKLEIAISLPHNENPRLPATLVLTGRIVRHKQSDPQEKLSAPVMAAEIVKRV